MPAASTVTLPLALAAGNYQIGTCRRALPSARFDDGVASASELKRRVAFSSVPPQVFSCSWPCSIHKYGMVLPGAPEDGVEWDSTIVQEAAAMRYR